METSKLTTTKNIIEMPQTVLYHYHTLWKPIVSTLTMTLLESHSLIHTTISLESHRQSCSHYHILRNPQMVALWLPYFQKPKDGNILDTIYWFSLWLPLNHDILIVVLSIDPCKIQTLPIVEVIHGAEISTKINNAIFSSSAMHCNFT